MDLLVNTTRPPLILSYGRSGSMWLAHDIGVAIDANPRTISADDVNFLKTYNSNSPVHSHYSHSFDDISKFTCFFNLRKNPVDTIISCTLTDHYKVYHVFKDENVILEPFTFDNWNILKRLCQGYIAWCQHYSAMLNPEHQVIYYEDYVAQNQNNAVYSNTYPHKSTLLINYQNVLDYVLTFKNEMLSAQAPFGMVIIA